MKSFGRVLVLAPFLVLLINGRNAGAQIIPLPPSQTGTVTGVLRNAAGMPAANVRMAAMTRQDPGNGRGGAAAMSSQTMTDALGVFRLENIPPGEYYIAAGRVDNPTYYPGTLENGARTLVSVKAGETVSGIEFPLLDASTGTAEATPFGLRGSNTAGRGRQGGTPRTGGPGAPAQPPPLPPGLAPQAGGRRGGGARSNTPPATANATPSAAWWTDAGLVSRLGLTTEQKTKIEGVFDQYRQSLIVSRAQLESGEALLSGVLAAETVDTRQAQQVIDRVIQARANMERSYAQMTMEMRQLLTRVQWAQLQSEVELDAPYQRKR